MAKVCLSLPRPCAVQALDKTRFMSLTDPESLGEGDTAKLEMKLIADKEAKTLTLIDRGCGMSKEDLINQLGAPRAASTTISCSPPQWCSTFTQST